MKKLLSFTLLAVFTSSLSVNAFEITGDNDTDFLLSSYSVAVPLVTTDASTRLTVGEGIEDAKLDLAVAQEDAMNRMAGEEPTRVLLDAVAYLKNNVEELEDASYEEVEAYLLSL